MKVNKLALITSLLVAAAVSVHAQVTQTIPTPVIVNGVVTEGDCQNSQGPWITLEGEIALGGAGLQLIFQNNAKGTHTATVTYTTNVTLLALGDSITIPKQPVRGGVGGNPHIWIQFFNNSGNLTEELYLGRCVQGLTVNPAWLSTLLASVDLDVAQCRNHQGPWITVSGILGLQGVSARFIFRNNERGTHTAEATSEVTIIPDGATVTIPKQPVRGGAGGNPLISVQFLDGAGNPVGDPIKLGRCVQLNN